MNYDHKTRRGKLFFIIDNGLFLDKETCDKILILVEDETLISGSFIDPPIRISLQKLPDEIIDQIYRIIKLYMIMSGRDL